MFQLALVMISVYRELQKRVVNMGHSFLHAKRYGGPNPGLRGSE